MTEEEEKAENYYFSLRDKKIEFTYENVRKCIKQAYIDGLVEGREERNCVNCSNHGKQFEVMKLEKENAELKTQIDKMKCCENCRYNAGFDFSCDVVRASKYGATKDKNGEDCHNFDKWELSEGK